MFALAINSRRSSVQYERPTHTFVAKYRKIVYDIQVQSVGVEVQASLYSALLMKE
jgi:hypothetical protein